MNIWRHGGAVKESQSRMVECCMLPSHTNAVGWHFWSSGNFCMSKFQKANQTPSLHVRFVREDLGSMHADLHLHAHVHWVYEYISAHMCVLVCVCIYVCMLAHVCACIQVFSRVCVCVCIPAVQCTMD
mmetsp:Transcript_47132/g.78529  ORF Transcript_47132/g.78529 Transcript_47132/m.78529 type:complete len:128 (-) Transcript_47132:313-696(-)